MDDDIDDVDGMPQLPSDTLRLLNDFLAEKDAKQKHFESLKHQAENDFASSQQGPLTMEAFGEDWQASQFWYTDETARTLAEQLLDGATSKTFIAIVSAPSVYIALRNIIHGVPDVERPVLKLLEYDRRFEVFGIDFVYYDFEQPLRLPAELKNQFDRVICDPPFLSDDCQTKTALSVRYLAKSWTPIGEGKPNLRFISCTGERVGEIIARLYGRLGVKTTSFEPKHSKGLSNEFRCYANFECEAWKWR
ncbi:Protein-lysine N-methyltransferase efm5 [Teratosphaeriaceae sp. CCFEE 6253]|nr:Protein-lysine N-methyltransferase efm5 [Teratosphaeriaceae sp. CCFEE 6253]